MASLRLFLTCSGRAEPLNRNELTLQRELCKPGVPVV